MITVYVGEPDKVANENQDITKTGSKEREKRKRGIVHNNLLTLIWKHINLTSYNAVFNATNKCF